MAAEKAGGTEGDAVAKTEIRLPRIAVITGDVRFRSQVIAALLSYYRVDAYANVREAIGGLADKPPSVILIDVFLPPTGGERFLHQVRGIEELKNTPVIAVDAAKSVATIDEAFHAESDDFLTKPFRKSRLLEMVSKLVNVTVEKAWEGLPPLQKSVLKETVSVFGDCFQGVKNGEPLPMARIERSCEPLIEAVNTAQIGGILKSVQEHDDYTYVHSLRLAIFLSLLGNAIGMNGNEQMTLATGGLMHDIGKSMVPLEVLNKPGKLNDAEWELMKSHVMHSQEVLAVTPGISPGVSIIALQHHEKLDGSGYPNGIKGKDLNELARMATIVDIYGALTDRRIYKPAMPAKKAMTIMDEMKGKLDMNLLKMFKGLLLDAVMPLE